MKAKYQSGTSFCIEISDSTSRTCMTVADAVRLKEELTKAIDDAEKDKREELTEFEKACMELYNEGRDDGFSGYKLSNEAVKESATELLDLAGEQFIKDGYVIEKKAFHDAVENISDKHRAEMSVEYSIHCRIEDGTRHAIMNWDTFQKVAQKFIDIGKAEVLKDLPRWRIWGNGACGNNEGHPIALVYGAGGIRFVSCLGITGEKYIMLDDLKKLPGFKENESHE